MDSLPLDGKGSTYNQVEVKSAELAFELPPGLDDDKEEPTCSAILLHRKGNPFRCCLIEVVVNSARETSSLAGANCFCYNLIIMEQEDRIQHIEKDGC